MSSLNSLLRPGIASHLKRLWLRKVELTKARGVQTNAFDYFNDSVDLEESKFAKILIANRSEIACRIIRTARRMGIKTVAVYSTADSSSVHVRMADEAVCLGAPAARDSYLNVERVLAVIRDTGAEAVHPGYGFLSENAAFAAELESMGVAFIGPSASAIRGMGDKLESKRLAMEAQVNTIPGFDGVVSDEEHCLEIARNIGYPVMIKASAGGGGKGMRIARNDNEAREGFRLSTSEAASSFGDDRMLVEKFIDSPRHIEIQVLGDNHGNTVYLNERECSIQRRNQKVIEEAPSVFLDEEMRRAMGSQAVALCRRLGYSSAGTVEFLADSARNFYFLEMNTRLQVEHPITECITGLDLVHQMIRIAKGHPLKFSQSDVALRGWAIESRVYAEDPTKGFGLPSVGRLYQYIEPTHIPQVRCDSGVEEGSEISVYYDPMISKLVCCGRTRQEAIDLSVKALDSYVIRGVAHNIALLRDILTEPQFVSGNISTAYLSQVYPSGFSGRQLDAKARKHVCALAAAILAKADLRARSFVNTNNRRKSPPTSWQFAITLHNSPISCNIRYAHSSRLFIASIDGEEAFVADDFNLSQSPIYTKVDDTDVVFQLNSEPQFGNLKIRFEGSDYDLSVLPKSAHEYMKFMPEKSLTDTSKRLVAPMPGVVKAVSCEVGCQVVKGQELCIVEAMKMQNSLLADASGKIKSINVKVGSNVSKDDVLVEFE
ncbi:propionyl-CoA carboxylase alpha chain, mitochondrial [Nilaparvata lugens]|uniref:propionyl-CoA carboxylase alpha chain, mitochondrial n=1 Tax=Nilaparvata lugens TaxID=108931 RepID=UPI000B98B687|nr:propionyl-CoA carboxylase alpha chain, mitochondrial [Nilaparvata lugens]